MPNKGATYPKPLLGPPRQEEMSCRMNTSVLMEEDAWLGSLKGLGCWKLALGSIAIGKPSPSQSISHGFTTPTLVLDPGRMQL